MRHRAFRFGVTLVLTCCIGAVPTRAFAQNRGPDLATLVILPLHVMGGDAETGKRVELLCDRLAQMLEKTEGIAVVDRKAIDKVLDEHKLDAENRPVLSYDAMVRVQLDTAGPTPEVRLSALDLSMGNVVASGEYPWKDALSPAALREMTQLCTSAAERAAKRPKDRIKVRLLDVEIVEKVARLEPLARQLRYTFEQSLLRSEKVVMVHHLEAQSAREESLLLLLGMSRLPGGRQFAPQANVTIELRLREVDAIGKTFEDTVVESGCRMERGVPGEWKTHRDKVSAWDGLVTSTWTTCALELEGVRPGDAHEFLTEMKVRRRQADAELNRFDDWESYRHPRDRMIAMAKAASVAAKLDPTSERASYLSSRWNVYVSTIPGHDGPVLGTALREVLSYLRNFREDAAHRSVLFLDAPRRARVAPGTEPPGSHRGADLDLARQIIDEGLSGRVERHVYRQIPHIITDQYESMLAVGVRPEEARLWRDEAYDRAREQLARAEREGAATQEDRRIGLLRLLASELKYLADEKRPDVAAEELNRLARAVPPPARQFYPPEVAAASAQLERFEDAGLSKRFQRWLEGADAPRTADLMRLKWPQTPDDPEFSGFPVVQPARLKRDLDRELAGPPKGDYYVPRTLRERIAPLGVIDQRLYVLYDMTDPLAMLRPYLPYAVPRKGDARVGVYPLGISGRPEGELTELPAPKTRAGLHVNCVRILGKRLVLATEQSGIVVYDAASKQWRAFGAEEGLPQWTVHQVHALDDGTLLCIGGRSRQKAEVFTLDVVAGKVTLLQRTSARWASSYWSIFTIWQDGGKVTALCREGIVTDLLGEPGLRVWPSESPHGWPIRQPRVDAAAVVGGRRFVMSADGLRETGPDGEAQRAWPVNFRAPLTQAKWFEQVVAPGELPGLKPGVDREGARHYVVLLGQDEAHLFLAISEPFGLICYDPEKDAWYGPVHVEGIRYVERSLGAPSGLWLTEGSKVEYVATEDLLRAAKDAGRVTTSEEIIRRRDRLFAKAPPLDRARFAMGRRRFAEAKTILTDLLTKNPEDPEALLVMGLLHEKPCLNDVETAMAYYRRLGAVKEEPDAALTGWYLRYHLLIGMGRLREALDVGTEMTRRFSIIDPRRDEILRTNEYLTGKLGG